MMKFHVDRYQSCIAEYGLEQYHGSGPALFLRKGANILPTSVVSCSLHADHSVIGLGRNARETMSLKPSLNVEIGSLHLHGISDSIA